MKAFRLAFPEQSALLDFEFEDFAYSEKSYETSELDTNIVIVNVGNLSRKEIAQQLEIISKCEPKVIGIDVVFNNATDTIGSAILSHTIDKLKNVVMATKLVYSDSIHAYASLEFSDERFRTKYEGFDNLSLHAQYRAGSKTLRGFTPSVIVEGSKYNAFSVQIAMLFDSVKTKRFLARSKEQEIINYTGNIVDLTSDKEYALSLYQIHMSELLEGLFLPSMIKNKIVILGFTGNDWGDPAYEQKYYTSLNKMVFGKGLPDMFGVVVHANVVSMIIKENYVDKILPTTAIVISFIIVFLNALFFSWLHSKNTVWHEVFTLLVPVAQVMLIAVLRYFLFTHNKYVLDLSYAAVLLVGVSFSASMYWGPMRSIFTRFRNRVVKKEPTA